MAIIICIALTVGVVNTFTIFRSTSHTNEIMLSHARTGIKVLMSEMTAQQDRFEDTIDVIQIALKQNEGIDLEGIWADRKKTESDFIALYGPDGNVFWQSDNYALADFNPQNVSGGGFKGVLNDSAAGLTVQAAMPFIRDGKFNGGVVCGMLLSENSWLDNLKEETESELTIFNGSTRYATTIVDNGKRAVGTNMAESVTETVIGKGQQYSGMAQILGQTHYVCYEPMLDVNGKLVGAYFSGISSAESDSLKYSMILMSIIVAIVVAIISMIVIGYITIRVLIRPIREAEKLSNDMSQGLLSNSDVKITLGNDELGDFVR